jgi:hypothetical protein
LQGQLLPEQDARTGQTAEIDPHDAPNDAPKAAPAVAVGRYMWQTLYQVNENW